MIGKQKYLLNNSHEAETKEFEKERKNKVIDGYKQHHKNCVLESKNNWQAITF